MDEDGSKKGRRRDAALADQDGSAQGSSARAEISHDAGLVRHVPKEVRMNSGISLAATLLCGFSIGCASVGPVITKIQNDGRGGLLIEKCNIAFSDFLASPEKDGEPVHLKDCFTQQIIEVGR